MCVGGTGGRCEPNRRDDADGALKVQCEVVENTHTPYNSFHRRRRLSDEREHDTHTHKRAHAFTRTQVFGSRWLAGRLDEMLAGVMMMMYSAHNSTSPRLK